jgi:hypothetical protein
MFPKYFPNHPQKQKSRDSGIAAAKAENLCFDQG